MDQVELLSAISVPITLYRDKNILGPATAFFYNRNGSTFLVSNWHVFSGRNSQTGQPLHPQGGIPNLFECKIHGQNIGDYHPGLTLSILNDDDTPRWFQHNKGQEYDIACMKVEPLLPLKYHCVQDINQANLALSVGSDVFIIGFPRGLAAQGIWPIWKRGTIAAEPDINRLDGLPIYLVDSASREGMSGSPVYIYSSNGMARMENGNGLAIFDGPIRRFLGIYSGRYGDEADMQLGRVWKSSLIDEMIDRPAVGSYRLIR